MSDERSEPRAPKVIVCQEHLDVIDLMDALGNVLGNAERDSLLKENLSGLKVALKHALKKVSDTSGVHPQASRLDLWLTRVDKEDINLGFSSLTEIHDVRVAAQARTIDYAKHGN